MDAHDAIEAALIGIIPDDGIKDVDGVTHTACSFSFVVERALKDAGYKIVSARDPLYETADGERTEFAKGRDKRLAEEKELLESPKDALGNPLVGHPTQSHAWPCTYFWSSSWTGGGHSGEPLKRREGTCTCPVDNHRLSPDPLPYVDKEDGPGKWIHQAHPDAWTQFEPRQGYSQNPEDYQ